MTKSLFNDTEPIPLTVEEIKENTYDKKDKDIPSLLPKEDNIVNNSPYSDNLPQVFVNGKGTNEKDVSMSGAFFLKGEELIADIRLEFNVKHPKYGEYIKRLKNFVKECEDEHILLSSSGI